MRVENVKGAVWTVDELEFYKRRPQRCTSGSGSGGSGTNANTTALMLRNAVSPVGYVEQFDLILKILKNFFLLLQF